MSRLALYLQNLQRFGIRPGLERIEALLARAGNPHLQYPHLLVGGTNGKGSTCEFTARLLAQEGRRIGLYTSPHLYDWNERIRILPGAGLFEGAIADADLDQLFDDALPHIEAIAARMGQPTEFEVVTFLGLWYFARQKVDAAVLEVGLGGKWDATNITDPQISVVTHVALDHCDRLGNTLEEIAADKVCIARPGRPFLTSETKENVLEVFRDYCDKIGAHFEQVQTSHGADFQEQNRDLAHAIAREFAFKQGWQSGHWSQSNLQIRGRREQIADKPRLIIDGANNPEGAQILADFIQHDHLNHIPREELILVLGILADKDWRQMTQILAPLAKTVIATKSNSPRAVSAASVAAEARLWCSNVEIILPVSAAVEHAKSLANSGDTILVTGSFTTIAEVPRPEITPAQSNASN